MHKLPSFSLRKAGGNVVEVGTGAFVPASVSVSKGLELNCPMKVERTFLLKGVLCPVIDLMKLNGAGLKPSGSPSEPEDVAPLSWTVDTRKVLRPFDWLSNADITTWL